MTDAQVRTLLSKQDKVLHSVLFLALLTGMRSDVHFVCMAEDYSQGEPGELHQHEAQPVRLLKSKAAEQWLPLRGVLENILDITLLTSGRLFPRLTVDTVVNSIPMADL